MVFRSADPQSDGDALEERVGVCSQEFCSMGREKLYEEGPHYFDSEQRIDRIAWLSQVPWILSHTATGRI